MTSSDVYEYKILYEVDIFNLTEVIDFHIDKRNTLDFVLVNNPDYVDAPRVYRKILNSCVKSFLFPIFFTACLPSTRHDYCRRLPPVMAH